MAEVSDPTPNLDEACFRLIDERRLPNEEAAIPIQFFDGGSDGIAFS